MHNHARARAHTHTSGWVNNAFVACVVAVYFVKLKIKHLTSMGRTATPFYLCLALLCLGSAANIPAFLWSSYHAFQLESSSYLTIHVIEYTCQLMFAISAAAITFSFTRSRSIAIFFCLWFPGSNIR